MAIPKVSTNFRASFAQSAILQPGCKYRVLNKSVHQRQWALAVARNVTHGEVLGKIRESGGGNGYRVEQTEHFQPEQELIVEEILELWNKLQYIVRGSNVMNPVNAGVFNMSRDIR